MTIKIVARLHEIIIGGLLSCNNINLSFFIQLFYSFPLQCKLFAYAQTVNRPAYHNW